MLAPVAIHENFSEIGVREGRIYTFSPDYQGASYELLRNTAPKQ